jgi:hypothetical protein
VPPLERPTPPPELAGLVVPTPGWAGATAGVVTVGPADVVVGAGGAVVPVGVVPVEVGCAGVPVGADDPVVSVVPAVVVAPVVSVAPVLLDVVLGTTVVVAAAWEGETESVSASCAAKLVASG